jgi:dimethylamine/trimethylamine dehydrogenase
LSSPFIIDVSFAFKIAGTVQLSRDPRHDVLFEPIKLGPVTTPNRFYQAPHCNGMGRLYPTPLAVMRGVKAEGGWGVVFNEQCDLHYTTDNPRSIRLWDEQDLPLHRQIVENVHEHGSLAGLMLSHNGYVPPNLISREIPLSPSGSASFGIAPSHTRAMDRADIRALRRWHRNAASLAYRAGYDLVMVYAGHDLALPMHFLSRRHNQRSDEYGGTLENRARLLRELIEETKEAVGAHCGVGVRLSVDELMGPDGITSDGEGREVVELLAELPDWWDVNVSSWANDSATSRFAGEGFQEQYVSFVKGLTSKPVVGVGRFTSPDTMVSQIRRGVLDLIGAARPSIADPFLPRKIEEGRAEDIRECIGCNICVSNHYLMAPSRCTQNPTFGEEWRRDWHPERIAAKDTDDDILIVGAGPAGLEAARALGQRGYHVMLAESRRELGGRVSLESRLPGLNAWSRVRDYRVTQIDKLPNVEMFPGSVMDSASVLETGCSLVAVATGSRWRKDGVGRHTQRAISGFNQSHVLTPDDVMTGATVTGPVIVYEDDHFYMASVIAEKLVNDGYPVTLVTPALTVARFTEYTLELGPIHRRLAALGVPIIANTSIDAIKRDHVVTKNVYSSETDQVDCSTLVMVAGRCPNDDLYQALKEGLPQEGPRVYAIGDCRAPGTIAAAVFSGHQFARDLSMDVADKAPFLREDVALWGTTSATDPEVSA